MPSIYLRDNHLIKNKADYSIWNARAPKMWHANLVESIFVLKKEQDEKKKRKSAFFIAIVLRLYKQIITTN